jgi:hypothetical protein
MEDWHRTFQIGPAVRHWRVIALQRFGAILVHASFPSRISPSRTRSYLPVTLEPIRHRTRTAVADSGSGERYKIRQKSQGVSV